MTAAPADHGSGAATIPTPPAQPGSAAFARPPPGRRRGRPAGRGTPAVIRRRDRLAQLGAADARGTPRTRRPRRLLDLHLHQLAAHAALRPGLGREVPRPRPDRDRRPHARVRVRAQRRQRHRAVARLRRRVPGRDRQRLRGLAGVREPLLAGAVHRGRRGPHPLPPLRRGRVRDDRDGRPAAAARGRRGRRRPGSRDRRAQGLRGRRRLADAAIARDVPRLRPKRRLRVARPPPDSTSRTTIPSLRGSPSTSGRRRARGRSRSTPPC